jgi:hypothetical protein
MKAGFRHHTRCYPIDLDTVDDIKGGMGDLNTGGRRHVEAPYERVTLYEFGLFTSTKVGSKQLRPGAQPELSHAIHEASMGDPQRSGLIYVTSCATIHPISKILLPRTTKLPNDCRYSPFMSTLMALASLPEGLTPRSESGAPNPSSMLPPKTQANRRNHCAPSPCILGQSLL